MQGRFVLVMSPQIQEEIVEKLIEKNIPDEKIARLIASIRVLAKQIPGIYETTLLDNIDPDDNMLLAAAYESKANYLVSTDNHLLIVKHYHGTQILTPNLFLRILD